MATTFRINPRIGEDGAGESDLIVVQPLALVSSSPADAASGIGVASGIVLEFNEVPAAVGTITLAISGGATVETFDLSAGGLIDGTTVTLDPASNLSQSETYDVVIGSDLTNLAGTAFGGDTVSFSTVSPDATAPALSSLSATATGETAMDWSVTTDEGNGTLYVGAWADGATPSAADVQAGTGAVAHGSQAVSATGSQSGSLSGLTAGTAYEVLAVQEDAAGNLSAAVSVDVTTDAPAPSNPVILRGRVLENVNDAAEQFTISGPVTDTNYLGITQIDGATQRSVEGIYPGGQLIPFISDTFISSVPGIEIRAGAVTGTTGNTVTIDVSQNNSEVSFSLFEIPAGSTIVGTNVGVGTPTSTMEASVQAGDVIVWPVITSGNAGVASTFTIGAGGEDFTLVPGSDVLLPTGNRVAVYVGRVEPGTATRTITMTCSNASAEIRMEPVIVRPPA